jgi:hypothetical protein
MSLTDAFEVRALNWLFTAGAVTRPTTWFLGLSTTTPTDAGANFTPPAGGAYARVAATFAAGSDGAGNYVANSAVVEFPESTTNWGTMTYGGIFDAITAGNLINYGPLRDNAGTIASVPVNIGQIVRIPIGAFKVYCD